MVVFFFLTGFLIPPNHDSSDKGFNPIGSIVKNFARLSSSHYFCMFAFTSFASTIGFGSKLDFGGFLVNRHQCSDVYWKNLLFIQNSLSSTEIVSFIYI